VHYNCVKKLINLLLFEHISVFKFLSFTSSIKSLQGFALGIEVKILLPSPGKRLQRKARPNAQIIILNTSK